MYGITSMVNAGSNDNIDADVDGTNLTTGNLGARPDGLPFIDLTTAATGCGDHKYDLGLTCQTCEITITGQTQQCADNNTGGINTDDYFTINLTATVVDGGNSNMFQVLNGAEVIGTGTYGNALTLEWVNAAQDSRFAADGVTTYTLLVRDVDDNSCTQTLTTTPENNCSSCPATLCLPITVEINKGGQ
ncbi:MAG: hypothetical protein AB8G22_04160 [Saprospiraceae bacterium]